MELDDSTISQLKDIISKKPEVLSALGIKKAGRPKGTKSSTVVEPGKTIEVIQQAEELSNEEPIPISATQAKKMLKKKRNYSEETKKKMLENLQKGREKLKAQKAAKEAELQKAVAQAKKEVVIKKYVVKPLQRKGEGPHSKVKKRQRQPEDENVDEEEDDTSIMGTTEYESDAEVYKKLKRKERLIKKANKIQKLVEDKKSTAPKSSPAVRPPPAVNPYNPFF